MYRMRGQRKERIWELDLLRTAAIVLMFIVHYNYAAYAAANILGLDSGSPMYAFARMCRDFFLSPAGKGLQISCGVLFAVLSGITTSFVRPSRGLIKALKYFLLAMALTLATYLASIVFSARLTIAFGVLHMLSVSMAVYSLLVLLLRVCKASPPVVTAVAAVLGAAIAVFGFTFDLTSVEIDTRIFMPLGIPGKRFFSADYYPLIPWTGIFLLGAALGRILYPRRRSLFPAQTNKKWHRPLTALGRYSIQFYLIHQVALLGVFCLLFKLCG